MKLETTVRNAQVDNIADRLDSGKLRIYAGSAPANANASVSGNTLLAEFTFAASAFGAAASGVATAAAIAEVEAAAAGTATFARAFEDDGTTVVGDLTVSDTGGSGEVKFPNPAAFNTGVMVSISSCTLTLPA